MRTSSTVSDLKGILMDFSSQHKSIGLIPTMGALHAGHLSLVELALKETSGIVISIFVNPAQFNDKKDLINYPRNINKDLALLQPLLRKTDVVFIPTVNEMFPIPDTRKFDFALLDKVMEGAHRPGHFNGVAQIVSKLLELIKPDFAYFGEKDFQQLAIIKALTKILSLSTTIVGCPIIRESDGLAMSSRNMLLSKKERVDAPKIYQGLCQAITLSLNHTPLEVKELVVKFIEENSCLKVEYFELVDEGTLQPIKKWNDTENVYGCIAVKAGAIRLIDNIKISRYQGSS